MQEWLLPIAVVLGGYTVLGLTGFGSALVVVPLLAWNWPLPEVVALTLLMDVPASAFHSGLNWRRVQWRELRRLLPGMVVGTLVGLWLMQHMSARWPLLLLGLYVAAAGLNALRPRTIAQATVAMGWAYPVGTAIGLVEMLFGTAGPLVVAWLNRRLSDVQQMRASTPMIDHHGCRCHGAARHGLGGAFVEWAALAAVDRTDGGSPGRCVAGSPRGTPGARSTLATNHLRSAGHQRPDAGAGGLALNGQSNLVIPK